MPDAVINTRVTESVPMVLILALNSVNDIWKAESYNKGGRNIRKTISGLSSISGKAGINPTPIPAIINNIGYGILILSAIADKPIISARINITML
jgi:hypothetical protein